VGRKLSVEEVRSRVLARITHGDAFRLDHEAYVARRNEIRAALAELSVDEMKRR
jgi:hypothetical protein